ncbi:MAG: sugar ABC transporter permease [Anaerolineales bacterium]|nr:sugar ABC transporter permease [Anaerolineales bacterium]
MNDSSNPESKSAKRIPAYLLSGLFLFLGVALVAWLLTSIISDPGIRLALDNASPANAEAPSFIIAFLLEIGIMLPILVMGLAGLLITLGLRLRTGDINAARWAQVALIWMAVGTGVILAVNVFQLFSGYLFPKPLQAAVIDQKRIGPIIALIALCAFWGWCIGWLNRNLERVFHGKEQLGSHEVRFAWNLLIPTLAVFIVVAARPLEQTFIRSLTDKRFAGQEIPRFIGLDNYKQMLGIRLDTVGCRPGKDGLECALSPNGSIQWETIDHALLKEGYRTAWTIRLPFTDRPTALLISGLDKDFLRAIGTTLLFTVISVSLELTVAMFMALVVNSNFKGRGFMRAVMLVPWAIPTVISARLWELMLKDTSAGIINRILMDLTIIEAPQAWLSVAALQMPSAILVDVWKTSAFMALLLLAGLQTIPSDLYEAASVDGASRLQQFTSITLPLMRPTIAVALVFRTLDALRVFDLFNVLFGRQQLSMATYNYELLVNSQRDGYASAVSIIIFLMISIFAIIYVRTLNVETE